MSLFKAASTVSLLTLASLRSPFVPDAYGLIGTMWLLTLVAADRRWRGYWWAVFGAAMIAFAGAHQRVTRAKPAGSGSRE